jgi:[acyl-carrier-protein] S-malonyltransferase
MGKAWCQASPAAEAILRRADDALGFELSRICFEGPEEQLNRTDVAQAALYAVSVASHAGLIEAGQVGPMVAAAGLSLGEFTALHLAGAFGFEEGLKLVSLRGRAMQEAAEAAPSGMVALVGVDEAQARALCDEAAGDGVLVPANFNAPGQVVLSGGKVECERAVSLASEKGITAKPLSVAGAFHSPLMAPAAERLGQALQQTPMNPPSIPVLSNVSGGPHEADASTIRRRLVEQLTQPVRWEQNMRWLIGNAEGQLTELAPGRVLSGLARRIERRAKVANHSEPT